MIDEHYCKWISTDATGMAQFVSERLGDSERLVPKWFHGGEEKPNFPLESNRYMAESEGFEPSIGYKPIHP